jgi:hypothetical protein
VEAFNEALSEEFGAHLPEVQALIDQARVRMELLRRQRALQAVLENPQRLRPPRPTLGTPSGPPGGLYVIRDANSRRR